MDLNYLLYREQVALMREAMPGSVIDRRFHRSTARFFSGLAGHHYPHRQPTVTPGAIL